MPYIVDDWHPVWNNFTPEQQKKLLDEDTAAMRIVAGILLAIVTVGFVVGSLAVLLMS